MSRAERRALDRQNKHEEKFIDRNVIWYENLSPEKKQFISNVVLAKIANNDKITASIMDTCLISAIDDVVGLSGVNERKIIKISSEYMEEYKKYFDRKEGFEMINKEELDVIKKRVGSYITNGMSKAAGIKALKKEFDIPNAVLSDCWVEVKTAEEESKKDTLTCNHNSGSVPIVVLDGPGSVIECTARPELTINENGIASDTDCDSVSLKNNLEVVEEIKVIKGKYGYYHKSSDGIRFSSDRELLNHDIAYKDKEELMTTRDKLINEYLDEVKLINKQIEELNNKLALTNKSYETMNNHFDEMEQVFNM